MSSRWAIVAIVLGAACAAPPVHHAFVIPSPRADARLAPDDTATPHVVVLGQVQRPGAIRYAAGLTLAGAIVDSGGFTELARKSYIEVRRAGRRTVVSMTAILAGDQPDVALQPGDVVFVEFEDW